MNMGLLAAQPGGPEVMQWTSLPISAPGKGEVLVRHKAIGVNFIDVYYRSGLYPWPGNTIVPGAEAAGVVEAVGEGVVGFHRGDRVAYVMRYGAYCQARLVPADRLVLLPDAISDEVAASIMLKGMTVQYLVTSSYRVEKGDAVLVHAAAGGVGLLMGQWLKAIGAHAIGTAGSADKIALARVHGYADMINYRTDDFVPIVRQLTQGKGVAAVYDSVGADTWRGSLKVLRKLGMFVSFGQSSGMITGFQLSDLASHGSLSANRPVLFDYIEARADLETRAADLFSKLMSGAVRADTISSFPLKEAGAVHAALEARNTVGAMVLIP
jgi:NADPH:quinone reductase